MKVKELIEELKQCNPEAEVILYINNAEYDSTISKVDDIPEVTEEDIEYCGGYSVVEEEFIGKSIVYLRG